MNKPYKKQVSSTYSYWGNYAPAMGQKATQNTQSYNRYAYCFHNPMKYTDPSGYLIGWYIDENGTIIGWDQNSSEDYHLVYGKDLEKVMDAYRDGTSFTDGIDLKDLKDPTFVPNWEERQALKLVYDKGKNDKEQEFAEILKEGTDYQGNTNYTHALYKSNIKNEDLGTGSGGVVTTKECQVTGIDNGPLSLNPIDRIIAHTHNFRPDGHGFVKERPPSDVDYAVLDKSTLITSVVFDYASNGEKSYIYGKGTRNHDKSFLTTKAFFNEFKTEKEKKSSIP